MDRKPTAWSFTLAFRKHLFAAMSGGASVPFTALAVFLDNKWAQLVFAACALTCAWFAAYRVWKPERQKVCDLEKRLQPKLKIRYEKTNPNCRAIVTFQNPDGSQTKGKCFRLEITTDSAAKIYECMGWLAEAKNLKTQQIVEGVRLLWPNIPSAAASVDIVHGVSRYIEICAIKENNQVTVTTEGWAWPIDAMHMFHDPGEYLFKVTIEARDTVAVPITAKLNWTGDWRTAELFIG